MMITEEHAHLKDTSWELMWYFTVYVLPKQDVLAEVARIHFLFLLIEKDVMELYDISVVQSFQQPDFSEN